MDLWKLDYGLDLDYNLDPSGTSGRGAILARKFNVNRRTLHVNRAKRYLLPAAVIQMMVLWLLLKRSC